MQELTNSLEKEGINLHITPRSWEAINKTFDPSDPNKNVLWTTDPNIELPVMVNKFGEGSSRPLSMIDLWNQVTLKEFKDRPALSEKVDGKWQTTTFQEFYEESMLFATALVKHGISERSSVGILR